jgi:hypothetical protein
MRIRQLRTYDGVPDLADHVIHFAGRNGKRINVDPEIEGLPADERLVRIVADQRIRAFQTFRAGAPVVCMTESTKAAVTTLIRDRRYTPCGIGFSKQFVFERDGGPALYVRGDEWPSVSEIPQPLRSRVVRFWPGAEAEHPLPDYLATPSEWLQEREWRMPGDLTFGWDDIQFLIVPHPSWQVYYADWISEWAGPEYGEHFARIPAVVMAADGTIISDGLGIWSP